MKTQTQIFWDAHRRIAELNSLFMEMLRDHDITDEELKLLIAKRPSVYGRFAGFVGRCGMGKP